MYKLVAASLETSTTPGAYRSLPGSFKALNTSRPVMPLQMCHPLDEDHSREVGQL